MQFCNNDAPDNSLGNEVPYEQKLFHFNNPTEILPGLLWLGGMRDAGKHIKDLKIRNVLNMAEVPDQNAGCGVDPYESSSLGDVKYKGIAAYDAPSYPIDRHFEETYEFIRRGLDNNERVYVHCVAGISRSASIVIAFLMRENRWTLDEALRHTRSLRSSVCPNDGFMRMLRDYERQLIEDGVLRRPMARRRTATLDVYGGYGGSSCSSPYMPGGNGGYDSIACYD